MTLLEKLREKLRRRKKEDFMEYETSSFYQMKITRSSICSKDFSDTTDSSIASNDGNHSTFESIGSRNAQSIRSNRSHGDISTAELDTLIPSVYGTEQSDPITGDHASEDKEIVTMLNNENGDKTRMLYNNSSDLMNYSSHVSIENRKEQKEEKIKNLEPSIKPSIKTSKSNIRRIRHPILPPNAIPKISNNPLQSLRNHDEEKKISLEHQAISENNFLQSDEASPASLASPKKLEPPGIDTSSALSSLICLNLLDPNMADQTGDEQQRRNSSQIVHDSFKQHVRNRLIPKNKVNERSLKSLPVDCDNVTFVSEDLDHISRVALDYLSCFQYKQAVDIFRVVLKEQRNRCLLLQDQQEEQEQQQIHTNNVISGSSDSIDDRNSSGGSNSDSSSHLRSNNYNVCHLQLADTLRKLSVLNLHVGRTNDAMGYCEDALKIHRSCNRPVQTTLGLMDVGMILFGDDSLRKSLQVWREALQMACMTIGYDHPFVAILLNNIGCLHYQKKDYHPSLRALEESLGLQRQMLSTSCSGTGKNNIDGVEINSNVNLALYNIAVTMGNIAMIFIQNQDYKSALSMLEEAFPIQESVVSSTNHPVIQSTLDYMEHAKHLQKMENVIKKNISIISSSLSISQRALKNNKTAAVASIFGDNADGIPIRSSGAGTGKVIISSSSTTTIDVDYLSLGSLVEEMTAHQRVIASLEEACDRAANQFWRTKSAAPAPVRVSSSGLFSSVKPLSIPVDVDDGEVIDAELHLEEIQFQAMEHLVRNEIKDALDLFECSTRSHRQKYGDIHHLVGTGLHNCGIVHMLSGQYVQANSFFQEALDVRTAALGPDHPDVVASMIKIALIQTACNEFESALSIFRDILVKYRGAKIVQAEEGKIFNNMGVILYEMGKDEEAFQAFLQGYGLQLRIVEAQNVATNPAAELAAANSLSNLGFVHARMKQYNEALSLFEEAMDIRKKYLTDFDPAITTLKENIGQIKAYGAEEKEAEQEHPSLKEFVRDRLSCNVFQCVKR